ncbi:MAG: hypothetical protein ACM36A_11210 [Bacteroidota bacterium]
MKLLGKAVLLALVLIVSAGAFATPDDTRRIDSRHVSAQGVPDDFIFAPEYTWLRLR